ncbi:MAG TPA: ABC transporter permease [Gaiellaceae bacterium]|jgi:peptide/nickel transport system permease protein|nr:ABC transporter permease [Gaiellaceae bacterium]
MRWFLRRLAFYVFALWLAITITFLIPQLLPGSPIGGILQRLTPQQIQEDPGIILTYEKIFGGKGQSLPHAYVTYLRHAAHLNFGISTSNYPTPVSQVIGRTLPYSIALVGISFLVAFILGTTIGMFAAWRRGGGFDSIFVPLFMALGAFPAYFTALLVVYLFGLRLGWFPLQHAYGTDLLPGFNWTFIWSAIDHGILPALVIVLAFAGGWVLNMRTVMINTISEDYVAMAQAKGLRDRRVMTRYAARNAILPPLNGFAPQFATAVGGVIFVELVFSYPGAGFTLQQAALGKDLPLTQALLLIFAVCPIIAIFIIDLVNYALDPRIRAS